MTTFTPLRSPASIRHLAGVELVLIFDGTVALDTPIIGQFVAAENDTNAILADFARANWATRGPDGLEVPATDEEVMEAFYCMDDSGVGVFWTSESAGFSLGAAQRVQAQVAPF